MRERERESRGRECVCAAATTAHTEKQKNTAICTRIYGYVCGQSKRGDVMMTSLARDRTSSSEYLEEDVESYATHTHHHSQNVDRR